MLQQISHYIVVGNKCLFLCKLFIKFKKYIFEDLKREKKDKFNYILINLSFFYGSENFTGNSGREKLRNGRKRGGGGGDLLLLYSSATYEHSSNVTLSVTDLTCMLKAYTCAKARQTINSVRYSSSSWTSIKY